jgi:hypothetical protein
LITDAFKVGDIYLLNCNVFVRNLIQFITTWDMAYTCTVVLLTINL